MFTIEFEERDRILQRFSFSSESSILSMGGFCAMSFTVSASSAFWPVDFS